MPISENRIAQTIAFQKNCALNALAKVLIKNIKLNKVPEGSVKALCDAFNRYYQTGLSLPQFKAAIQIGNPIHQQVILGPVLRTMLGDREVVGDPAANKNKMEELDQPGHSLEDVDIMPLANFFGIRVESYSSFKVQALMALSGRNPTKEQVEAEVRELQKQADLKRQSEFTLNSLEELDKDQVEAINGRRVDNSAPELTKAQIPVLKLWNQTTDHFGYEEDTPALAATNNDAHEGEVRFAYGSERGGAAAGLDGPDAEAVRKKIKQRFDSWIANPKGTFDLSAVLTEYEQENGHGKKKPSSGPFGAFTDVLGGTFSSIGEKIFGSFARAFMNEKGEPDFGVKISSDGVMGIFEGILHFIFKIFGVIKGLAPVAGEIRQTFESMQKGGANPMAGGSNPLEALFGLGQRFADASSAFASFVPEGGDPSHPAYTPLRKATETRRSSIDQESSIVLEEQSVNGKTIFRPRPGEKGPTIEMLD